MGLRLCSLKRKDIFWALQAERKQTVFHIFKERLLSLIAGLTILLTVRVSSTLGF